MDNKILKILILVLVLGFILILFLPLKRKEIVVYIKNKEICRILDKNEKNVDICRIKGILYEPLIKWGNYIYFLHIKINGKEYRINRNIITKIKE